MSKLTVTERGLTMTVTAKYGIRADSRSIANALGIKHRSLMKLIHNHLTTLEEVEWQSNPDNPFHHVRFEIARGNREQGGGTPERFAMLTETQCYFLGTLSKNTAQVVEFKKRLVIAFAHMSRLREIHSQGYIPFQHLVHDSARAMYQHAAELGSHTPENIYHSNIERMINQAFGLKAGQRGDLTAAQKSAIGTAYQIADAAIKQELANGRGHKAAYAEAKRRVNDFVQMFARPILKAA